MALDCNTAFGRYLRILRERKRLSLDEVDSLSRSFPESINKGYLSRCENGRQRIAFSKIVALSRIYEVPTEVFAERMELDMELDRVGGPETEGKVFSDLNKLAAHNLKIGKIWDGYGHARDATFRAYTDEVVPRFSSRDEQLLISYMNAATAAMKLGRYKYALHELHYVQGTGILTPEYACLALERLGHAYWHSKRFNRATTYLDQAISEYESAGGGKWLGFFYSSRASLADEQGDFHLALQLHKKAFEAFKAVDLQVECAKAIYHLARAYFHLEKLSSARRAITSAKRLARRQGLNRTLAFLQVLLGEIEELENKPKQASARWREAALLAKKNNDRPLRFRAELLLFRQALSVGNEAAARAVERRLLRLAPWVPEAAEELAEFRRLRSERTPRARRVATAQPPASPLSNA